MSKRNTVLLTLCFIGCLSGILVLAKQENSDVSHVSSCNKALGMVLVKGGTFTLGAGAMYPEETPSSVQSVNSFYMSRHEVTNGEFSEFVAATNYITVAERQPRRDDYPHIPAHLLQPGSAVFEKLSSAMSSPNWLNWWKFTPGANWKNPLGPGSDISEKKYHPVIHIAYEDAVAYAQWKGHRLPTEAEFEYASRGGLEGKKYATGDSLTRDGMHHANTWQGVFPMHNTAEDGFEGLAPVGCYPSNPYGIHDLIGNVWEWTQSVYYPRHYKQNSIPDWMPDNGLDPNQPSVPVRVIKGGSFLCSTDFCMRYRPAARHAQDIGLGTSHIGFRTVKDLDAKTL